MCRYFGHKDTMLDINSANIDKENHTYKYVVNISYELVVFCNMGKQRFNEALHKRIVARLKEIRKQKGITQENVRFDLDINISRIEMGQHSITITTLADLCDYYGVTFEEFFHGIGTK